MFILFFLSLIIKRVLFRYFCKNEKKSLVSFSSRPFKVYFCQLLTDTNESLLLPPVPREKNRRVEQNEWSDEVLSFCNNNYFLILYTFCVL